MRKWIGMIFLFVLCLWAASGGAESTEIVMTFGGDAVLGTREEWKGDPNNFDDYIEKNGVEWPFSKIAAILQSDHMTLVNLECVLQKNAKGLVKNKKYRFRGDPLYTDILTAAGIEQVNIANNHYIDYAAYGKKSTQAALRAGGIAFSGYKTLYVYEKDGYKIGFGGCRETVYLQNKAIMKDDIKKLKAMGCDVIVYSCHWGKEYSATHNNLQKRMAKHAIEAGADIIIGTHPHCVQGIDSIGGVPVLYSLGNLMFGGTHEMRTFDAFLARAVFRFGEKGYQGVEIQPLPILTSGAAPDNNFQPIPAEGEDYTRIIKLIQKDSQIKITEKLWFPQKSSAK